ncbi:hypothetical protein [Streptomyces sp. 7N604]|uniref:hypothetical protein n=1 Tax=Streptomyces sp. 7N604 TaxID=3457415 RepID=UPI003FD524A2
MHLGDHVRDTRQHVLGAEHPGACSVAPAGRLADRVAYTALTAGTPPGLCARSGQLGGPFRDPVRTA